MNSSWGLNLLHFALSWSQSVLLQLVSKHISNLNLLERTWRPKKSKHKIGEAYVKSLSLTLLKHVFLTPNQDPWSDKSSCRYEDGEKNWNVLETSELSWPWLWKIWMESMLIPNSRIPISTSLSIYAEGGRDGLMRKDLFYLRLFGQRHKLISLFYWDICEFL